MATRNWEDLSNKFLAGTIRNQASYFLGRRLTDYPKGVGDDRTPKEEKLNELSYNIVDLCVDGDTCSIRGIYSDEANEELKEQMRKPLHWINLDGNLAVFSTGQAIDTVFALTLGVPGMKKLTDPVF